MRTPDVGAQRQRTIQELGGNDRNRMRMSRLRSLAGNGANLE